MVQIRGILMGKSTEFHGVNQLKFRGISVIFRCFLSTFSSVTTSEIHALWVLQCTQRLIWFVSV